MNISSTVNLLGIANHGPPTNLPMPTKLLLLC